MPSLCMRIYDYGMPAFQGALYAQLIECMCDHDAHEVCDGLDARGVYG